MNDPEFTRKSRNQLRRIPSRGSYDRKAAYSVLDEAIICHVGFTVDGQPFVIPTLHARVGDDLYVHGAAASRMLKSLAGGIEVCVTVTCVDGIVLARSAFHHSMNYRSVMVFGQAKLVNDAATQLRAFESLTEHLVPGRWSDLRKPTAKELRATKVLKLPMNEASVKTRSGPPSDDEEDYALPHWAGVLPIALQRGRPEPDPMQPVDRALPRYLKAT